MKKLFTLFFSICLMFQLNAQFGTAPDFSVVDLNGNTHNLYEILDSGKIVIVDVSATWCPPCWSNHTAHILEDIYKIYGPEGSNLVEVIFYEGDAGTTQADMEGTGSNTLGDWITGTSYPLVNEAPLQLNLNIWAPEGFPTVNIIRPSDREIIADAWNLDATEIAVILDEVIVNEGLTATVDSEFVTMSISPNPTADFINYTSDLDLTEIKTFDRTGKVIESIKVAGRTGQINVADYQNGMYFIHTYNDSGLIGVDQFNKIK